MTSWLVSQSGNHPVQMSKTSTSTEVCNAVLEGAFGAHHLRSGRLGARLPGQLPPERPVGHRLRWRCDPVGRHHRRFAVASAQVHQALPRCQRGLQAEPDAQRADDADVLRDRIRRDDQQRLHAYRPRSRRHRRRHGWKPEGRPRFPGADRLGLLQPHRHLGVRVSHLCTDGGVDQERNRRQPDQRGDHLQHQGRHDHDGRHQPVVPARPRQGPVVLRQVPQRQTGDVHARLPPERRARSLQRRRVDLRRRRHLRRQEGDLHHRSQAPHQPGRGGHRRHRRPVRFRRCTAPPRKRDHRHQPQDRRHAEGDADRERAPSDRGRSEEGHREGGRRGEGQDRTSRRLGKGQGRTGTG